MATGKTGTLIDLESSASSSDLLKDDDLSLPLATVKPDSLLRRAQLSPQSIPMSRQEKLSGWLLRHRRKGFLKSTDRKWYDFVDDRCRLLCYSSPDETVPSESLDVSRCAITVDPEYSDTAGIFTLKNAGEGTSWTLQAASDESMKRWVTELQKRREEYHKARSLEALGFVPGGQYVTDSRNRTFTEEEGSTSVSDYDFCESKESSPLSAVVVEPSNLVSFDDIITRRQSRISNAFDRGFDDVPPVIPSALMPDIPALSDPVGTLGKQQQRKLTSLKNMFHGDRSSKPTSSSGKNEKVLEDRVLVLQDDLLIAREELAAQKEIVRVLRKQLDFTTKEKEALRSITTSSDPETTQMEILRDRCRLILELEEALQNSRVESDTLFKRNETLKSELTEMARQNEKLREELRTKDHAIVLLNEQIQRQETSSFFPADSKGRGASQRSISYTEQDQSIQRLTDMLEAYKEKLVFLNEEIVNQNTLRTEMINREERLRAAILEWEAKFARLESRHLFILKAWRSDGSKMTGDGARSEDEQIRDRILEEALEGSEADAHSKAILNCDKYGFFVSRLHYTDEEYLERKGLEAERKERMVITQMDPLTTAHRAKWDMYLAKQPSQLQMNEELKGLMRVGCPSDEIRSRAWRSCIASRVDVIRRINGANYYQALVKDTSTPIASSAAKQIKIDLCRTLPNNVHFMNMDSDLIPKLEEVLVAYSRHNPAVGYCQGMNRLAAVALMFLNEEDAFWCLVAIVEDLLVGYFTTNMIEAQVDQRILKDIFAEKLPKLHAHLSPLLDITLYSFNWFLTIFVDNVHPEVFMPIWDAFLVEGRKVLFRYSLAMFKYFEDRLLDISDQTIANKFLRTLGDNVTDVRRLQLIAFDQLNPFPFKLIRVRRAIHYPEIKREMEQLDLLRSTVLVRSTVAEDDDN